MSTSRNFTRFRVSEARMAPVTSAENPLDPAVPDLLHATPMVRVDEDATRLALTLSFASGVSGGFFADALDGARLAPSTWQPESFASDLFLSHRQLLFQ